MKSPSQSKAGHFIATFHTHLGAMRFYRLLRDIDASAAMMPVPRKLSASCGTCVRFSRPFQPDWVNEDLDAVYTARDGTYQLHYRHLEA